MKYNIESTYQVSKNERKNKNFIERKKLLVLLNRSNVCFWRAYHLHPHIILKAIAQRVLHFTTGNRALMRPAKYSCHKLYTNRYSKPNIIKIVFLFTISDTKKIILIWILFFRNLFLNDKLKFYLPFHITNKQTNKQIDVWMFLNSNKFSLVVYWFGI